MTGSPAVLVLAAEADAVRSRLKGGNAMRSMRPPARAEPLALCDCDSAWPSKAFDPSPFHLSLPPSSSRLAPSSCSRRCRSLLLPEEQGTLLNPVHPLSSLLSLPVSGPLPHSSLARPGRPSNNPPSALACSPSDKVAADSILGRGVLSSLLSDDDVACRCPP